MTLALLPQYEKEAMGVIVGLGAVVLAAGPLRTGRYPARPSWNRAVTRLAAAGVVVCGAAIAAASFVVNVEDETYWGTFRDKAVFAGWVALVAVVVGLSLRRASRVRD